MCNLNKTSNPTLPDSSSWRQRRPDLVLVQSPKWSYSVYRDRAYPSPPMSGSPTSPRRSTTQFTDDRSSGAFGFGATAATSAPGIQQISQTRRASMEGPVAIPAGYQAHQQQQYGQYRPPYPEQQRYELQPRPISTHPPLAPQYHPSYSQAQQSGPLPLIPTSRSQVPGMATFQGPTSLSGSQNPRVARTSRRAKAHVARACQNCKKAHLSCDEARPCARCVSSGKQATCIDVEHKKRGRPRLRDDRDQRLELAAAAAAATVDASARQAPNELTQSGRVHRHGDSLRVLRSQESDGERLRVETQLQMPHLMPDIRYPPHYQQASEPYRSTGPLLTAFMNMDLRILKASPELRRLFADGGDVRGRPLSEFVALQDQQALHRIQSELRDERTSREPTFLPGIFPEEQEQNAVASVDVEAADPVSQGYNERRDAFSIRTANGRTEQFEVKIRLARTSTFFATLILQPQQVQPQPPQPHNTYGRPGGYLTMPQASPIQMGFPHSGPPSPYNTSSAPTSPFSSLHNALITTLPPAPSHSTSYSYAPSQARADQGLYPSRYPSSSTAAGMYPPPPPTLSQPASATSDSRPNTARERHRPEPLGNLQLPPIFSSAPTTPLVSDFYNHHPPAPSSEPRRHSPRRARSSDRRLSSEEDEEDSRKRRRLDITEIIER